MYKLLAVDSPGSNYASCYAVTFARSFEEAKQLLLRAEEAGEPFDALNLPVADPDAFWAFVEWMEHTHRRYPISIYGNISTLRFIRYRDELRARGFPFHD